MHSPATGILIAEMILDGRASSIDVRALAPTRFREGRLLLEQLSSHGEMR
jgi:glycine/D-amino acid oxidase-like deaminating enzyme